MFYNSRHKQHANVLARAISYSSEEQKQNNDNNKSSAAVQKVTAPKLLPSPPQQEKRHDCTCLSNYKTLWLKHEHLTPNQVCSLYIQYQEKA